MTKTYLGKEYQVNTWGGVTVNKTNEKKREGDPTVTSAPKSLRTSKFIIQNVTRR